MRLSQALREEQKIDLRDFSLPRYGYDGDIEDIEAVAAWLDDHPLLDVEIERPRTTSAAIRPQQQEFRRLLLQAYEGRCAVSGCDIEELLDAAHLRSWREGSGVGDGILMRCDLHRLFDAGLLQVGSDYRVAIAPRCSDYQTFDGIKLRMPKRRQDWPRLS